MSYICKMWFHVNRAVLSDELGARMREEVVKYGLDSFRIYDPVLHQQSF